MPLDLGHLPHTDTANRGALDAPGAAIGPGVLRKTLGRDNGSGAALREASSASVSDAAPHPGLLPSPLKNHNCTKTPFPASAKRTAFALQFNVMEMVKACGLDRVGFLTLTFAEHILDPKEAQRRLHSLTTHILIPRYGRTLRVYERQKSGRIHYHLLVNVGADIRSGFDFEAIKNRDYRSAGVALRAEWAFWRATAKHYGFGRTELLPIRSDAEAVGKYVGKYISKHLGEREERDKGVRLVSYGGCSVANTRFAWAGGKAKDFRKKLRGFVLMMHEAGAIDSPTVDGMRRRWGTRWCWYWRDSIFSFPIEEVCDE